VVFSLAELTPTLGATLFAMIAAFGVHATRSTWREEDEVDREMAVAIAAKSIK
jgi:hypothetical protein